MNTNKAIFLFICALMLHPVVSVAGDTLVCEKLSRNLWQGSSGDDVRILQQVLNKKQKTAVVNTGVGSSGLESTYFGSKTRLAIVKFQELYKNEVLLPAGLSSGTGFVGPLTRAKLIALCHAYQMPNVAKISPNTPQNKVNTANSPVIPTPVFPPSGVAATSTIQKSGKVYIISPSTYVASAGMAIKIASGGLPDTGNVVHIDDFTISATTIDKRGALLFTVPSNTPEGIHALWIATSKGDTNKILFIVTDGVTPGPVATSATPSEGGVGTVVTITGSGFTATGNQVRAGFGKFTDLPSADGKTLQFIVNSTTQGMTLSGKSGMSMPFLLYIVNENGMSKSVSFTLKI